MANTENKGLAKAYILAIIAITAWGFSFIWEDFLIKNHIEIFTFIFERMLLAAVILWKYALFQSSLPESR